MSDQSNSPLVSILIPTYNRPFYFEQALQSALSQTYANIEIVVADDSTNDETEKLIQPYLKKYPVIRFIKNPRNLGQFENDLQLIELSKGDYINFLMDDDLFHPQKLERMVPYIMMPDINLVTSHRQEIDAESNLLPLNQLTKIVFQNDTLMDGKEMAKIAITKLFNFIGEPTTVLFNKKKMVEPFGVLQGRRYGCNVDLATWYGLLSKGKGVYLVDTLSYYRRHQEQQYNKIDILIKGLSDNIHSLLIAPSLNIIKSISIEYFSGLDFCLYFTNEKLNKLKHEKLNGRLINDLKELYTLTEELLETKFKSLNEFWDE